MAWALYAASHGLSEAEIESEILHAHDLSKKGGFTRQLGYAERTATKAIPPHALNPTWSIPTRGKGKRSKLEPRIQQQAAQF